MRVGIFRGVEMSSRAQISFFVCLTTFQHISIPFDHINVAQKLAMEIQRF